MTDYTGTPIPTDQAWRTFGDWKSSGREIGVIFYGGSGTSLYTMGFVESARNGKLLLKSDTVRASFNLTQANFTYGPVQTWPKWPSPPIVEVIAVQAQLENGDWLASQKAFDPNLFHRAPCQNSPEVAWGVANQLASIVSPSRAGGRRARRPLFWRRRSRVWDGDGLILGVAGVCFSALRGFEEGRRLAVVGVLGRCRARADQGKIPMKSHTPECAKIEQFAATLTPPKSYHLCVQDFDTKDYTLEFYGRLITITQQQFDDGTWQDIVRSALQ